MKYKIGDLVKIKSMTWWKENRPKSFPKLMAKECCGEIVEIMEIYDDYGDTSYSYKIELHSDWWIICEDWIEKEIKMIIIPLKQLKNEI